MENVAKLYHRYMDQQDIYTDGTLETILGVSFAKYDNVLLVTIAVFRHIRFRSNSNTIVRPRLNLVQICHYSRLLPRIVCK